jgi:diguanylate cyclase (GGDEF)-like protein/PAS domain S-box-containing protein
MQPGATCADNPGMDPSVSGARALEQRVQLLASLVDTCDDAIVAVDMTGTITTWNRGAAALYGWSASEAIGRHVSLIVPEGPLDELRSLHAALLAGQTVHQADTRRQHRDGHLIAVSLTISMLRGLDSTPVGYAAVGRDDTERRLIQDALAASEARFRALVQHSADVAAVVDVAGHIQYVSRIEPEIGGHDIAMITGANGWDLVHEDDRPHAHKLFAEVLSGPGEHRLAEMRIARADGVWRWVEAAATNLLHEPAVAGIVVNLRDINRRKHAEAALYHRAHHDQLTGLPNRSLLLDRIKITAQTEPVALLLLDIDEFKLVNDTHGHAVGDTLLRLVAARLRDAVRVGDTVARLGGDEFVVLCPGIVDPADAVSVADQIHIAFEPPFELAPGVRYFLNATIGIATSARGQDPARLLADADAAMYETKRRGRGRHGIYDERLRLASAARLEVEAELRGAVERGELHCHYQPIVDLGTGLPVGVEALARWHHPQRGVLLPADWVPVAESSALMVAVGRSIIEQAARDAARWVARGRGVPVAVNLSARQLLDDGLPDLVETALRSSGLPPGLLSFEVTEHAVLADPIRAVEVMDRLQELGVRFSLDDFGTGYSSLAYLKQLPVELVKIDQSFIEGVAHDWNDRGIVQAVVQLGRMLGRTVLAEGVEDDAQWSVLRSMGCQLGQGFRWSPAVPAADVPAVLDRLERATREHPPSDLSVGPRQLPVSDS